jgi:hypothetical protein
MLVRFYGPEPALFENTWHLPDVERIDYYQRIFAPPATASTTSPTSSNSGYAPVSSRPTSSSASSPKPA